MQSYVNLGKNLADPQNRERFLPLSKYSFKVLNLGTVSYVAIDKKYRR